MGVNHDFHASKLVLPQCCIEKLTVIVYSSKEDYSHWVEGLDYELYWDYIQKGKIYRTYLFINTDMERLLVYTVSFRFLTL